MSNPDPKPSGLLQVSPMSVTCKLHARTTQMAAELKGKVLPSDKPQKAGEP